MLFKLTNKNSDRMTHCGVLEFVADEGICYLPHWVKHIPIDSYWILQALLFGDTLLVLIMFHFVLR